MLIKLLCKLYLDTILTAPLSFILYSKLNNFYHLTQQIMHPLPLEPFCLNTKYKVNL